MTVPSFVARSVFAVMVVAIVVTCMQAQVVAAPSTGLQFYPAAPCRVVDTRNPNGPLGGPPIQGGTSRSFPIPQSVCNIPSNAGAYVFTVTAIPEGQLSLLTAYPTGESRGPVTTLVSRDGRYKSEPTIVPAGTSGAVSVYASNTTNVVIDYSGYFAAPSQSGLDFYPLTPCRLVDTRGANGPLGGPFLQEFEERDFPLLESPCIPQGLTPVAYSLNFTAVPMGSLNSLIAWPTGQQIPLVFTLTDPTATVVADMGILAAGVNGDISVYPTNNTNLIIDINGYFAPPATGGLTLHLLPQPCRAYNSQKSITDMGFSGMIVIPVGFPGNHCGLPGNEKGYVFNATVTPPGELPYLTLWAHGQNQPVVANLEAFDGSVTSNMAIVPTTDAFIDAYAAATTNLSLDIMSYFAP